MKNGAFGKEDREAAAAHFSWVKGGFFQADLKCSAAWQFKERVRRRRAASRWRRVERAERRALRASRVAWHVHFSRSATHGIWGFDE